MLTRKASFLGLTSLFLAGVALGGEAIPNWPAPATWSPARARGALSVQDVTPPLPFIGLAPCRILDTRGNGAPITGGIFTGGSDVRNYTIPPICGVPFGVRAVSLNFTVTGPGQTMPGFLLAWPTGAAVPPVSILNWDHVPAQIANAAVVPTDLSGSITVNVSAPTHLIMDINGYYANTPATATNAFVIANSGILAIAGATNSVANGTTGVRGEAQGASGISYGVFGYSNSATGGASGVFGAAQAGSGVTFGVQGETFSTTSGASGIYGLAFGATGTTYGVKGVTNSSAGGAVGVYGFDGSGSPPITNVNSAGVLGASNNQYGVVGVSRGVGVRGVRVDSAGNLITAGYLGSSTGVEFLNGLAGVGTKSFIEPHPTDASKLIRYVSLEGPEAGTYFRGRGRFQGGLAAIELPEDFRMVTDPESLSIQVTPIGEMATVAVARIGLDGIVVKGSRDVEFFYLVNGVRRAYNRWDPIQENEKVFVPESPEAKLPKYLSEEERGRLIANGTYNADGTVNMDTAERLGWAKAWRDREEQAKAAAAANAAAHAARFAETK